MPAQPPGPDWDAAAYDRVSDPHIRWGAAVLDRLRLRGDERVLDAGCGSGRVTELLLDRLPAGHVTALDASAAMLDQARLRLGERRNVAFVHADLLALTPAHLDGAAPLDAVFSTATFHWVPDHGRLFANLAAVLRPGGQLVAQCGGPGNVGNLTAAVRSLGVERVGTWLYPTVQDTERHLRAAGFRDVQVWTGGEPTRFAPGQPFQDFLATVCLREHLATLPAPERADFVAAVAAAMGEPVLDYVRLNLLARRG